MRKKLPYLILFSVAFWACKKDSGNTAGITSNAANSPVIALLAQQAPKPQSYFIDAGQGGSFTTSQGTTVSIPANAFTTQTNMPVTGMVTVQFLDIYKKSDMLLVNMPTVIASGGAPLRSGGEFFIKALQNSSPLLLASGKKITVNQPANLTGGVDTANAQNPFAAQPVFNCPGICPGEWNWFPDPADSVTSLTNSYIFSLYQFHTPADSGSWCNSDNSTFFSAYTQTTLTLAANDSIDMYHTEVYLIFKNIASMVHVYRFGHNTFPYSFAPLGLQCTVVAIGVKNNQAYSAFVPITIGANQTVPFSLSPTTTSALIAQLQTLN